MKKTIFTLALAAMALVSCNNKSPKLDEQSSVLNDSTQAGLKIAYIEVDSLMTQFEFAKEKSAELEKKSLNARNTLNQKGNQLQAAANNFQQKLQNNGFTSREQAESVQAALQKQQNDLAALQARLENELASEQQKFLQALQDSLNNFLTIYNKDKKFDVILNKSSILFAEKKFDITQDVINGLNKRYSKSAKPAAPKEEKK
ncbi:MAG: OmpH family outer membrane protein [Prevotella sp.]|nr:OmpH family outer membrane protein [Prevotella sp.]